MNRLLASNEKETPNQWSIARQVLPLALSAPEAFEAYRVEYVGNMSPDWRDYFVDTIQELFFRLSNVLVDNPTRTGKVINISEFCSLLRSHESFTKASCYY